MILIIKMKNCDIGLVGDRPSIHFRSRGAPLRQLRILLVRLDDDDDVDDETRNFHQSHLTFLFFCQQQDDDDAAGWVSSRLALGAQASFIHTATSSERWLPEALPPRRVDGIHTPDAKDGIYS